MRVFMLGWEFPPYISGGLGTACQGLTRAMSRAGMSVTFVLPRPAPTASDEPARLLSPSGEARGSAAAFENPPARQGASGFENVSFRSVPAQLLSPYPGHDPHAAAQQRWAAIDRHLAAERRARGAPGSVLYEPDAERARHGGDLAGGAHAERAYRGDLLTEADRYARLCVELARDETFDVIHAHDWLSFPAAMAVAGATGKPMIAHVHSTELDRAGENVHQPIYDIERRGMHAAVRVITVSHFTSTMLQRHYGLDPDRIDVVYNAVDPPERTPTAPPLAAARRGNGERRDPVVLFLGRVTMQKGPRYFIEAATKVLARCDRARFVVTGSGDQMPEMIDLAARRDMGERIKFTGFLEGEALERVFQGADVYVMPSVSEPFGLAAMEAMRRDVPVIVSRTSGVSEALHNVLKVDFWDTDEIADKIIAVLNHPCLSRTLRHNADREAARFTWSDAARRCRRIYEEACAAMPR